MNDKEALAQWQSTPQWKQMEERFYRDKRDVARIFAASVRAEVFRFKADYSLKPQPPALGKIQGIPYYEVGAEQGRSFALRLAGLVLNPKNYVSPGSGNSMCEFEPTFGFRVWSQAEFVDIILCFNCSELMFLKSRPADGNGFIHGLSTAEDMSLISGQLWALVEEAFAP